MDADSIIELLDLQPHPEGGHFREVYRDAAEDGGRGAGTAIYFLLKADEASHWHRVDAAELWHHYAGAPLELSVSGDGEHVSTQILGPDLLQGERPLGVVPPGAWQAARPLGGWTLVGCTVAPAFTFDGFELAPPDWHPAPRIHG